MQESQTIEWKRAWQDEYLKWLCAYANTDGGTLYIGVNDDGYVVGLKDSSALLEVLPNKINDKMGIVADIQLHTAQQRTNIGYGVRMTAKIVSKLENQYALGNICLDDISEDDVRYVPLMRIVQNSPIYVSEDGLMEYISISVQAYPFAISCEGKYYKRSGSVIRELNGFELQSFLLKKAGMSWDAVPVPYVEETELSRDALDTFRGKTVSKRRMTEAAASAPDDILLRDLKLYNQDSLTRAAVLMFHPDPEQYVAGAYIKVGYFAPAGAYGQNKVDDIIYFDDIHGPLISQVDRAINLIYTKYLKALISYNGLQRIETFLWPMDAFREVLLNAINHKEYGRGVPIQIRIYDDKIIIWNDGQWPDSIDVSKVYEYHQSVPHNPKIADVFYRSGEIESWGSGFEKIKQACDREDAPYPVIEANPKGGVKVTCNACDLYMKLLKYGRYYDTYPEEGYADRELLAADDKGAILVDANGVGLVTETVVPANPISEQMQKSLDRMMEILSSNLSDGDKRRMLPIAEYLKLHDVIDTKTVQELTGKGKTTAFRYVQRFVELDVLVKERDSVSTIYRRK